MFFYNYDLPQLEKIAEEKLRDFDVERLTVPKSIDVYDFIEASLDVPYDWKTLTPNRSLLGFTAFTDGYWYSWEGGKDELPTRFSVAEGTILIDNSLVEPGASKGRENFTVIHECFHQFLHKKVFKQRAFNYQHYCKSKDIYAHIGKRKPSLSGIEITEWQANAATAAFLMPQKAVTFAFCEEFKLTTTKFAPIMWSTKANQHLVNLSNLFGVSLVAMKYRLETLGLLKNLPQTSQF